MASLINLNKSKPNGWAIKELALSHLLNTKEGIEALKIYESLNANNYNPATLKQIMLITMALQNQVPLSRLENPIDTNEFEKLSDTWLVSTRCKSVQSYDNGKTWLDIDKKTPFFKMLFHIKDQIKFPYLVTKII